MLLTIEKVIILKSIDVFSEISEHDLLAIAMDLELQEYKKGSVITKEGEYGDTTYIIIKGEVSVVIGGKQIDTLGDKTIFGELEVFDPQPRFATITTTKDTLLFKVESDMLNELIDRYTDVARGIIKILAQRVRVAR